LQGVALLDASIEEMAIEVQAALEAEIASRDFDDGVRGDYDKTRGVITSVVGEEVETFVRVQEREKEEEKQNKYSSQLNPGALHPLRIAGIVIFTVTAILATVLFNLASRRKQEREWDREYRKRVAGGLITEGGLDYMLRSGIPGELVPDEANSSPTAPTRSPIGKGKEESGSSGSDPLSDPKLPLPGSYMNVHSIFHTPTKMKIVSYSQGNRSSGECSGSDRSGEVSEKGPIDREVLMEEEDSEFPLPNSSLDNDCSHIYETPPKSKRAQGNPGFATEYPSANSATGSGSDAINLN
jgi:hypothetical protein